MYSGLFLLVLLPWLRLATTLDEASHQFQTSYGLQHGAIHNKSKTAPNHMYQVCIPNWDLDDKVSCYHGYYQSLLLLGSNNNRNGWLVFCDKQIQKQCFMTSPDSTCVHHEYSYVGQICDLTKVIQPQEDTLSNQTSEPDINREVLKYIAIGIFLGAFLFPVLLGICCFYCSQDDCQEEEMVANHTPNLEHTISVVGRNQSVSVAEVPSEDIPPSYDACNETCVPIQEEDEM